MITWLYIFTICSSVDWGFFAHRLINRVAVFTLPTEMIGWYKPNIDYLSEHAVDPDKRRYATQHEAVRHYIDLDQWGQMPFDHMPRSWDEVLALNIRVSAVRDGDTTMIISNLPHTSWGDSIIDFKQRLRLVRQHYLPFYYEDEQFIDCDSLRLIFPDITCLDADDIFIDDVFSEHGIVPYHLQAMQRRLTNAFKERNFEMIARVSAELGHYIGDACVPLHTTSNYNGQLTDQVGIHAFWESRIPELFALEEFDMVVGTASYIEDPQSYFWNLVLDSHKEVNEVLSLEKELRHSFPADQQFCFEDRLNQLVKTQCAEFAKAYHLAMDKMVEDRFRVAVKALGDAWYTAWVDAGQPTPPEINLLQIKSADDENVEKAFKEGRSKGRDHTD